MFQGRRGYLWLVSAAMGTGCLALAACSHAASSATAASAGKSGTAGALAGLTAAQVESRVLADARAAANVRVTGDITAEGVQIAVDLGLRSVSDCGGTIGLGSKGSISFTAIGGTVYVKPDARYWTVNDAPHATQVIALVHGRYLKVASSDKSFGSFAQMCGLATQLFRTNGKQDDVVEGKARELNGALVLPLTDKTSDDVDYVTDAAKPEIVESLGMPGGGDAGDRATFTYGSPVTVTAPAASDVLSGSQIGL